MESFSALVQDSLESTHPVNVEVNDPAYILSLFDAISYNKVRSKTLKMFKSNLNQYLGKIKKKGSGLICMMNAFLSEPTFRRGVSVK